MVLILLDKRADYMASKELGEAIIYDLVVTVCTRHHI
jgi:hypothetical protein